jgi:small subunit ribosomal protein S6
MRYETVFILTPVLSEAQIEEAAKKHLDYIKENGAKIVHQESWGLKKLAYPIVGKQNGFYFLVEFESEGSLVQKLELEFKRDERILRYLTVKLDKHGMDWAEKRRVKIKSN